MVRMRGLVSLGIRMRGLVSGGNFVCLFEPFDLGDNIFCVLCSVVHCAHGVRVFVCLCVCVCY